jgi:hypothetical protein
MYDLGREVGLNENELVELIRIFQAAQSEDVENSTPMPAIPSPVLSQAINDVNRVNAPEPVDSAKSAMYRRVFHHALEMVMICCQANLMNLGARQWEGLPIFGLNILFTMACIYYGISKFPEHAEQENRFFAFSWITCVLAGVIYFYVSGLDCYFHVQPIAGILAMMPMTCPYVLRAGLGLRPLRRNRRA